jgi:hypothetical protein
VIGLFIAYFIMSWLCSNGNILNGLLWFSGISFKSNIIIGALIMVVSGYFIGKNSGKKIIIANKNAYFIGIKSGLCILIITAFFSGFKGYFEEGIDNYGRSTPIYDYIVNPFLSISLVGFLPTIILGIVFGWLIKNKKNSKNIG